MNANDPRGASQPDAIDAAAVVGPASSGAAIGVIGIGAMGGAIARRLLDCGHRVVICDVDPMQTEALAAAGAIVATSAVDVADQVATQVATQRATEQATEAATEAGIIFIVVVDAAQTDDVLFGERGITASGRRGLTIVMCSTVGARYAAALRPRLFEHGIDLVDAPISGGPQRARDGTMSMMIGAAHPVYARVQSLLAVVASRRFHVGERAGDGSAMKIVNNMLAGINLAAAAEALALAEQLGMDLRIVRDVVNASSGGSWIFADRVPRMLDGDYAPAKAAARILAKDVGIALEEADAAGVPATIARAAHDVFTGAVAQGLGSLDDAAVIDYCRAQISRISHCASKPELKS